MEFKCVIAMVKPDFTDDVITAAKKAGARGATIIPGKGTGAHEAKTFFGLTLDIPTDVIVFLLKTDLVDPVLEAVAMAGRFSEPGTGIAYVVSVDEVVGLESQLSQKS